MASGLRLPFKMELAIDYLLLAFDIVGCLRWNMLSITCYLYLILSAV